MYDAFKDLIVIDWASLILSIITILTSLYVLKSGIEKFCNSFGIETPWMKQKREKEEFQQNIQKICKQLEVKEEKLEIQHKSDIDQLKELNSIMCESISDLKKDFATFKTGIENNEIKKNIKKLRWDIINFASGIAERKTISLEQYNVIFKDIKEYETLVEKYHLKNGQVNSSVDVIQERYEQDLRSGLLK